MKLVAPFPWQRFTLTLLSMALMLAAGEKYVDWLWYFATLDPHSTSGAAAITALSAGMGVLFLCFAAVNIWFITGSVKSIEAMFRFNAATVAQSALSAVTERVDSVQEARVDERIVRRMEEKFSGDPSYRPLNTLPDAES